MSFLVALTLSPTTSTSDAQCSGLTTTLHLAVEQGRKPLSLLDTGGQRRDSP